MFSLILIILGLFVWMALPQMLLKKKKNKPYKRFIALSCKIVGVAVVVYGVWNLAKHIWSAYF